MSAIGSIYFVSVGVVYSSFVLATIIRSKFATLFERTVKAEEPPAAKMPAQTAALTKKIAPYAEMRMSSFVDLPQQLIFEDSETRKKNYIAWADDFYHEWQKKFEENYKGSLDGFFIRNPLEKDIIHHVFGQSFEHPIPFAELHEKYEKAKGACWYDRLEAIKGVCKEYLAYVRKLVTPDALKVQELYCSLFFFPSFDEVRMVHPQILHEYVNRNQSSLVALATKKQIPQFGLRGTDGKWFEAIQRRKTSNGLFNLTAPASDKNPEEYVKSLTSAARRALYFQQNEGGVFIVNTLNNRHIYYRTTMLRGYEHEAHEIVTELHPEDYREQVQGVVPEQESLYKDGAIRLLQREDRERAFFAYQLKCQELIVKALHITGAIQKEFCA